MRSYERDQIEKVIAHVEKDIGEKHLIRNLCLIAFMGETMFKQLFKLYSGDSFHQWLIEKRMLYAADLMKDTQLTLKQISKKTGYAQEKNFSRAFKKRWLLSPTAWRKANGYVDE